MIEVKYDEKGLVPAIIQDATTNKVLMMGYMNEDSLAKTLDTKMVTFYSRSRQQLWTKGEESGNYLELIHIEPDCDKDTLLVKVRPAGPTCHTGADTCWKEENRGDVFLQELEAVLRSRKGANADESYTARLYAEGTHKIAQKVGEEAVELVIESMMKNDDLFLGEAADLMYHYIVLLIDRGYGLDDVVRVLRERSK